MRIDPVPLASLLLLIASAASAVTMDWTPIGDPGNACDPQSGGLGGTGCYGAVGYGYSIGTYEVTNAQYAEFLNAKAISDPLGLYNTYNSGYGGITRSGVSGGYTYSTIVGRENMPVNLVSLYDALRFANWMSNGQGSGDTETGSYTLLGGTATPSNGETVTRNAGATIVLTSEDEWYKAAYYDASSASYFAYAAGSNAQHCGPPTSVINAANCYPGGYLDSTDVGSYTGSASPYGTFDQGGNAFEWNEAIVSVPRPPYDTPGPNYSYRSIRGGSFLYASEYLAASRRAFIPGDYDGNIDQGFRLAMIPEPSTGLLLLAGLLGLSGWRKVRA